MYAIISDGGRQFKVEEGQILDIDLREASTGDQVTFDRVLAFRDDDGLKIGKPVLKKASVTAEIVAVTQGPNWWCRNSAAGRTRGARRATARCTRR